MMNQPTVSSSPKYDYLVVGSGLFGATFAYRAARAGKRCLVIDRRLHLGGNVYCEQIEGINVHKYGAHIFHTSNKDVWDFVNSIVEFNRYTNSPIANYKGKLYNLPFNLNTFYQMWGVTSPAAAQEAIDRERAEIKRQLAGREPQNLEEQALSLVGRTIYETLIKEYTEKQWGRKCTDLPAFIIKRLPVRMVFDNNYFNDKYQGIPIGGYNRLIEGLLKGVDTITGISAPLNPPSRGTLSRAKASPINYDLPKENAQRMQKQSTEAESVFWSMVRNDALGVSFRRQHVIGEYIVDFVCLEKQLIVEIDGAYHKDESHNQPQYDQLRTSILNEYGFTVLRLTNEEVMHATEEAIDKVRKVLDVLPLQGGLRGAWRQLARHLVYTGPIDEYFGYALGKLSWRTVSFRTRIEHTPNYQGNAVVNYTSKEKPYTRVIEHKHFEMFGPEVYGTPTTVVSEEFSTEYREGMEPYYPVNDRQNNELAAAYRALAAKEEGVVFGGRLADYRYYDMAPVIEKVLKMDI